MKIKDIPKFIGRSASALAADFGMAPQNLGQYLNGQRGKPSKVVEELVIFCGLNREEVIFSDPFDLPDINETMPEYWLALALEALGEAESRGWPADTANEIALMIHDSVAG